MEALCADRQRILVVEDMPDNLLVLQATLEHEGYEVLIAANGEEALRLLGHGAEVDLILSDVMMPGISGYELCRRVRMDSRTTHLPVVLITAKRLDESDALHGMDTGADDYLTRPIDPRLLVKKLHLHLRRKKSLEHWQAKYQRKKEMVAMQEWGTRTLVHDMRNPLTGAMAAVGMLELGPDLTPEQRLLIDNARICLNRQRDMLQDLLLTAAAQNGQLALEKKLFDFSECAREQVVLHGEIARGQRMQIVCPELTVPHLVVGDARLLSRVVANLLMNALKHGQLDSTITVWLGPPRECPWPIDAGGQLSLAVHNDGPAIPAQYHQRIFQPFGLGPAGTGEKRTAGVGLGLNFCLQIIQMHNGSIDLLSPPPGRQSGAVFWVTLP